MVNLSTPLLLGFLFLCIVACPCEARGGGRGGGRSRSRGGSSGGGGRVTWTILGPVLGIIGAVVFFTCCYFCKLVCVDYSEESPSSGETATQAAAPERKTSMADVVTFVQDKKVDPPSYDSVVNQKDGLPYSAEPNGYGSYPAQPYPAAGDDVMSYPSYPSDPSDPSAPLFPTEPSAPPPPPMGGAQYGVAPQGGPGYIGSAGNASAV